MGRIQTNIGLITGMPIADTVDSLMELASKPVDLLVERNTTLQEEQTAVTELSAYLYTVRYITNNLGKEDLYRKREATSSNPDALTATVSDDAALGNYSFTPLRTSQNHQLLGSAFRSNTDAIGAGELSFRFGDHVERTTSLELLGGGEGFARGKIRITDRSGERALIDLTMAQDLNEVVETINSNETIGVRAELHGDGLRLIDYTGETLSNLRVQEYGGRTTAASLGLAGLDVADSIAEGADVIQLYDGLALEELNDGNGVRLRSALPEIAWTLRDGTSSSDAAYAAIDFTSLLDDQGAGGEDLEIADVLKVLNEAAPDKLRAEIGPDGDRLIITDLTTGDGQFTLTGSGDQHVLADLGIDGPSVDGAITGRRILGGAGTVLLSSLGGGNGLGELGAVSLTDGSGATAVVDLSAAETLDDVLDAINAASEDVTLPAPLHLKAQVNAARTGIELIDTSGGTHTLIVADGDATGTAAKLGIAVEGDVTRVDGGDLHLQVVGDNTRLDGFNGGEGVARGTFSVIDSAGHGVTLDIRDDGAQTIGDVVQMINSYDNVQVLAEINETGDGIRIVDLAHGIGELKVTEGTSTTAADLNLLGDVQQVDVGGQLSDVIDGSITHTVKIRDPITADTLLADFNDGAGVDRSTLTIVDSAASLAQLDLDNPDIQTIGDVIDAINGLSVEVYARMNDAGDGILLEDLADGKYTLTVMEGDGTTAKDLHLLGKAEKPEDAASPLAAKLPQTIDGSMGYDVLSLEDLKDAVNALDVGVTAVIIRDGSSKPYRLALLSDREGAAGELVVDSSELGFSLKEAVRAQDALLTLGHASYASFGVFMSSASNSFDQIAPGLDIEIKQATGEPVTVGVQRDDTDLVASVIAMVENYNKFREKLTELTAYDVQSNTSSLLTGDATALRLDIEMPRLLTERLTAVGSIQSLAELGLDLKRDGTLEFDKTELQDRFAADPDAVEKFFVTEEFGLSAKFDHLIERLAGEGDSLLMRRLATLVDKITDNKDRIEFMNKRLDTQRNQLFMQFYRMEMAIGKMQGGLAALDALQPLPPMSAFA
ncbi:MAG: flagellar filament capping protein FliD [Candidatus Nealsonbacteria bacterium]|nr:flagellar filament capping protein FliD [Candidatus Nealsonbacteria bacterium]